MAAIRIIDNHTELESIGTNTHAQIDTHIAAAGNYVKRDGSLPLTADWDIGNGIKLIADHLRARDGDGLKLYDDGGNGIFVEDGGQVGIGTTTPADCLEVEGVNPVMVAVHATNQPTKSAKLGIVQAGANSYPGIWFAQTSPDTTNYAFMGGGAYTLFNSPPGAYMTFRIGNANKMTLWPSGGFAFGDSFYITDPGTDNFSIEKKLGIRVQVPTRALDIDDTTVRLRLAKTPASAGAAGSQGDICWDANYVYVCVATNTWKRSAISTW